jgi:hypothetical protein
MTHQSIYELQPVIWCAFDFSLTIQFFFAYISDYEHNHFFSYKDYNARRRDGGGGGGGALPLWDASRGGAAAV